ncbi:hypothetical protein [Lentzea sp. NPDC092896]|uniref:hypothetical protein n=1 Tax=Lentzea sp. NPDC092896 TaxID=3364127 RepID=UPI003819998D
MTTGFREIDLTKRNSAQFQRYGAFTAIYWAMAGGIVVALFSGLSWWAIVLWELLALLVVGLSVLWLRSVDRSAGDALRLYWTGSPMTGLVMDGTVHGATGELTISPPAPLNIFLTLQHQCDRDSCVRMARDRLGVLRLVMDTDNGTWAVLH